jgi:hypothetical protein
MQVQIAFNASGFVRQTVDIIRPGYTPRQLIADLNAGTVWTTSQEGGDVEVVESGEVVARVVSTEPEMDHDGFGLAD